MNNQRRPMRPWRERLLEPDGQEKYHATSWLTCAVGEQHQKHPNVVRVVRMKDCQPVDEKLLDLGMAFSTAVRDPRCGDAEAESILDAIEDRVLELKWGIANG